MKRVLKGGEPSGLQSYRIAQAQASWEEMRDDSQYGGKNAYNEIRAQTHRDQKGLCAYCEININESASLMSRVEHFHPKSDRSVHHNWALDWRNMLAVCAGGSYRYGVAPYTMEPLDKNLSCDAHKDRLIQQNKLSELCEGWVLNPLQIYVTPSLFYINKLTGELKANKEYCDAAPPWPGNQYGNTEQLVEQSIAALNLNCDRLCQARLIVIWDIENSKKRQRAAGYNSTQGLKNLAKQYLRSEWPAFFTTICLCLGVAADNYLQSVNYQG